MFQFFCHAPGILESNAFFYSQKSGTDPLSIGCDNYSLPSDKIKIPAAFCSAFDFLHSSSLYPSVFLVGWGVCYVHYSANVIHYAFDGYARVPCVALDEVFDMGTHTAVFFGGTPHKYLFCR
jgi:hypothetical protein